jgi:L-asparaginase/Glu-tRNA(Gln) amidotransferase subunit D
MKNILIVFTGGTIGSMAFEGTINTTTTASYKLFELFKQQDSSNQPVHFTSIQPLQMLSENLAPKAWQLLIQAIEAELIEQYDGIIVTHGTDTLAYTAAALSFYFNTLKIPLLLVSSDYPLGDVRANGLNNFICAVEFIRQELQAGVFVPYCNQGQSTQIHRGSRLTCSLQLTGDFFSVQSKHLMDYENQVFSLSASAVNESTDRLTPVKLKADFFDRILMIKPYPGLDYSHFNLDHVEVVLHDLYHSGTACASNQWGENHSLLNFIAHCTRQNIKVYLAPAIRSADSYQSTRVLIEQGANMIWNMSIEAAYVKLMLAYGNFTDELEIAEFLEKDIAREHV